MKTKFKKISKRTVKKTVKKSDSPPKAVAKELQNLFSKKLHTAPDAPHKIEQSRGIHSHLIVHHFAIAPEVAGDLKLNRISTPLSLPQRVANRRFCKDCGNQTCPKFLTAEAADTGKGCPMKKRFPFHVTPVGEMPPGVVKRIGLKPIPTEHTPEAALNSFKWPSNIDRKFKTKFKKPSFPIDLVYLWVDGSDPEFQASIQKHLPNANATGARFTSSDELRYSLRSVERFAPWINHIYIVTNGQVPVWLNRENKKVSVVTHKQIFKWPEFLPAFQSGSIEMQLQRIPGLSEHFLFANDDEFFGRPVTPDQFFTRDGKMKVQMNGSFSSKMEAKTLYKEFLVTTAKVLDGIFSEQTWHRNIHHIRPLKKSLLKEIERRIPHIIKTNSALKSRTPGRIAYNIGLISAFALKTKFAVEAKSGLETKYHGGRTIVSKLAKTIETMPHLVCINNGEAKKTDKIQDFLFHYFPNPCDFENTSRISPINKSAIVDNREDLGKDAGFVLLSTGLDRRPFLERCIFSIRHAYPAAPIHVLSDVEFSAPGVTNEIVKSHRGFQSRFIKTQLIKYSPFKETIFVDDDTVIQWSFGSVAKWLDETKSDIAMVVSEPGKKISCSQIGRRGHFNSGVIIFRKTKKTFQLFRMWHKLWNVRQIRDQIPLSHALCKTKTKVGTLPIKMNLLVSRPENQIVPLHALSANILHWTIKKDLLSERYQNFLESDQRLKWSKQIPEKTNCIMTGCDEAQSYLLKKWYAALRRFSTLPIVFADFGMSEETRAWCAKRGEVIQSRYTTDHPWFQKPLAVIQSSYGKTLWIDLDARVLSPIDDIFKAVNKQKSVGLTPHCRRRGKTYFNTGIFVAHHGSAFLLEVAQLCLHGFKSRFAGKGGDQSIFNGLAMEKDESIVKISNEYNWLSKCEKNKKAKILHFANTIEKSKLARYDAKAG